MMGGSHRKPRRSAGLFVSKTRRQLRKKSPGRVVQRNFQRDVHKGERLASVSFAIGFLESICFRRLLPQTRLSLGCFVERNKTRRSWLAGGVTSRF